MRTTWFRAAAAALLVTTAVGLALAGCGKDVCEEAYDKRKDCAESMSCTAMDPSRRTLCQQKKMEYSLDYLQYQAACRMPDGSPCKCEGTELERWQIIDACTLSPESLCDCR